MASGSPIQKLNQTIPLLVEYEIVSERGIEMCGTTLHYRMKNNQLKIYYHGKEVARVQSSETLSLLKLFLQRKTLLINGLETAFVLVAASLDRRSVRHRETQE